MQTMKAKIPTISRPALIALAIFSSAVSAAPAGPSVAEHPELATLRQQLTAARQELASSRRTADDLATNVEGLKRELEQARADRERYQRKAAESAAQLAQKQPEVTAAR